MHSQTLNKTNSTNSSRYPQYSTLYHFSTFLQHHAITQTQEGGKKWVPPAPLIEVQKPLSRFNIASSLQISERLDQSIIVPFPMELPPKHLTPHIYSEKRQFLHEFELPSNLTETAPRSSNFQPNPTPVAAAAAPCKLSSAHVVPAHSAAEAAVTTHPTKHSQHPRPPKPQWLFILAVSTRVLEPKIPTTRKTAKHPP